MMSSAKGKSKERNEKGSHKEDCEDVALYSPDTCIFINVFNDDVDAALANLANVLNAKGRTGEAERAYVEALNHRSNMADVHYNL